MAYIAITPDEQTRLVLACRQVWETKVAPGIEEGVRNDMSNTAAVEACLGQLDRENDALARKFWHQRYALAERLGKELQLL